MESFSDLMSLRFTEGASDAEDAPSELSPPLAQSSSRMLFFDLAACQIFSFAIMSLINDVESFYSAFRLRFLMTIYCRSARVFSLANFSASSYVNSSCSGSGLPRL